VIQGAVRGTVERRVVGILRMVSNPALHSIVMDHIEVSGPPTPHTHTQEAQPAAHTCQIVMHLDESAGLWPFYGYQRSFVAPRHESGHLQADIKSLLTSAMHSHPPTHRETTDTT
jgi:hypothetical protein